MTEELWDLLPENERAHLVVSRKTGNEYLKDVSSDDGPPPLTEKDAQKIRLLLSSYQDGSGMTPLDNGLSLPGWRDFERVVAAALNGKPPKGREGKNVFDVVVPIKNTTSSIEQGISCKMKNALNTISTSGRVSMDLANAAGGFADYLKSKGIYPEDYRKKPKEVGIGVIELVKLWHEAESIHNGGRVELNQSYYLVLSWNDEKQQ